MKQKRICAILIGVLLVAALVLNGCTDSSVPTSTHSPLPSTNIGTVQIGWALYGAWITEDGTLQEKVNLSIAGEMPANPQDYQAHTLTMDFIWPDGFAYESLGEKYVGYFQSDASCPCYWGTTYVFRQSKGTVRFSFTLFPEDKFVIAHWEDQPGIYLVAATDPNIDLAGLFTHHKDQLVTP